MALAAGRLNKQLKIQARADVDGDGGSIDATWTDVTTTWAEIQPGGGREFIAARQETPELSHIVTIRYRSGLTPKHRFVYGSGAAARVFTIASIADPGERHEELVCYSSEVVATP